MSHTITRLLKVWVEGRDPRTGVRVPEAEEAFAQLISLVLPEIRQLARAHLSRERAGHTLSPTEIIHEAFLKLVKAPLRGFESRTHFFALAARLIREVLVDHARNRRRLKRGIDIEHVSLADTPSAEPAVSSKIDTILAVDEALTRLEARDPRQSQVVQLRFFGGLTLRETAQALDLSLATVERLWSIGRRRLARALATDRMALTS